MAALISMLGGCYTQLQTFDSAYDENVAVEDTVVAEEIEEFDRDYPPPGYAVTFSYYHPGFTVGYGFYDPWDWYYYPAPVWYGSWYAPYYPVYSCWPYYSGYYHYYPVVYYGGSSGGGHHYGGGGGKPSDTRDFGNSRGYAGGLGTRGRGGIRPGPQGDDPVASLPAVISRTGSRTSGSSVSDGKKVTIPSRRTAVNRPPTRRTAQVQPVPAERSNTGSSRGGPDRSSVSTSSSPKSSPPANSPGSSGRSGSSGGSSRGGSPRSR